MKRLIALACTAAFVLIPSSVAQAGNARSNLHHRHFHHGTRSLSRLQATHHRGSTAHRAGSHRGNRGGGHHGGGGGHGGR